MKSNGGEKNQNRTHLKPCFLEFPATRLSERARPEPGCGETVPIFKKMKYKMN